MQIWSTLSALIPIGIVTGWLAVKRTVYSDTLQPAAQHPFSQVILSAEKSNFTARVRTNDSGAWQLEWINKAIVTVPSAVIYRAGHGLNAIESAELVGRIETKGTYYFPLKKDSTDAHPLFILYDFIHQKIIDSVKL